MPLNPNRLLRWSYTAVSLLYLWSIRPFLDLFYGPAAVCPSPVTSLPGVSSIWWLAAVNSLVLGYGKGIRVTTVVQFLCLAFFALSSCRATNYGDQIFASTAFLLMFLPSNDQDNPWLRRTLMLFLCTLYATPLVVRLHGHHWWDGTASWIALADPSISRVWRLLVDQDPQRLPAWWFYAMTYAALAYEGLFPVLIWFKKLRLPLVIAGLIFHAAMGMLLDLGMFPFEMAILLVACLEPTSTPAPASDRATPAPRPTA